MWKIFSSLANAQRQAFTKSIILALIWKWAGHTGELKNLVPCMFCLKAKPVRAGVSLSNQMCHIVTVRIWSQHIIRNALTRKFRGRDIRVITEKHGLAYSIFNLENAKAQYFKAPRRSAAE
ncbi:hypothetical protein [Brucella pituitosa]|uniref:hypothetical protein n=1 Tax=Brucella pituitosa TaxID=571256 RepID=UPI003F4AD88C